MLQAISWKDYFITMGLGVGIYYGWWLVRYYPGLGGGRPGVAGQKERHGREVADAESLTREDRNETAKRTGGECEAVTAGEAVGPGAGVAEGTAEKEGKDMARQMELPVPAVIGDYVFLPEVATRLIEEVARLMDKAQKDGIVEGELMYMLQRLLGKEPNRRLRDTPYEEKLNALLVRELERYGSVRPDAEVVRGLWRG